MVVGIAVGVVVVVIIGSPGSIISFEFEQTFLQSETATDTPNIFCVASQASMSLIEQNKGSLHPFSHASTLTTPNVMLYVIP